MPRARLIFDGDGVYTEKEARVHKLTQETETKIENIPGIVDDANSDSTTDALSAHMGKVLQDQINNIVGLGTFLSNWDCTTGLPQTEPAQDPYTYKAGNYYIVSRVASSGGTNYRPYGSEYNHGVASQTVETNEIHMNDWYIYDGSTWLIQPAGDRVITVDDMLKPDSTNPVENRAVYSALSQKQNAILDLAEIRAGATAGSTAIQSGDNITELTNNIGYQTAGDVASAINDAIEGSKYVGPTAPDPATEGMLWYDTTNDLLKVYNGTSWGPVDTQVAKNIFSGTTAPSSPVAGQVRYDTTNNVLKVWNGTSWDIVDINLKGDLNTKTFYLSSTSDLTNAQAAYDWYAAGKNPIIIYDGMAYNVDSFGINGLVFAGQSRLVVTDATNLSTKSLSLLVSSGVVTGIGTGNLASIDVLETSRNYSTTYTPTYDGNPTTKKYVDDKVKNAITSGTTAPSNPVVGQLWYDTTNEVLKVWNGTTWITIQELLVNGVNIKTVNNHDLLGSGNIDIIGVEEIQFVTQSEYDALPSSKLSDSKAYFIYSGHGAAIVSDEPFGSTWDGITTQAPSKNAIYDVLGDVETLLANL